MSTSLIINADDLGFSPGITDGILRAHTHGVLTSTTLMTTMPDRDRAISLAKATPTLGVGIHLCLTQGIPLTKCSHLLNSDGQFPRSIPKLALRLTDSLAVAQAEAEWDAQVQYALDRGLTPTHLDSHKHIHHLPTLQHVIANVARRHNIPFIRCARELSLPDLPPPSLPFRLLIKLAHRFATHLNRHHLRTTDFFFGLATTGATDLDTWHILIDHLRNHPQLFRLGEVMVHPGYPADLAPTDTRLIEQRQLELDALLDPALKTALATAEITLTHYGQLADL